MLFNSYTFIFAFLPFVLIGYHLLGRADSRRLSLTWLITCSVAFYGLWNPVSLLVILPSVVANFLLARWMQSLMDNAPDSARPVTAVLALGIVMNLCFLGYFKYRNFFVDSVNHVFGADWPLTTVLLPLGISFITFQKIAFLVDVRSGAIKKFDLFDFLIFVFFYPQLIAGPIVHYREMMPQFAIVERRLQSANLAVGLCLFALGLFKKTVLADGIAPHATFVFSAAESGQTVDLLAGWLGALAYTLQIYFDFSGYSDMALGLARMFGVRLPANFNSPLKASSIIDFWARWHMTLTRFLTAYIYTPLVMSLSRSRTARGKPGLTRKNNNPETFLVLLAWPTFVTMFASGLWHGAGTTFVIWGVLHGAYLIVNHAWRQWRPQWDKARYEQVMKPLGFMLTFAAVVVAMVFFRASTLDGAANMLSAVTGANGVSLPAAVMQRLGGLGDWLGNLGVATSLASGTRFVLTVLWVLGLLVIALAFPNSLELLRQHEPALGFKTSVATRPLAPTGPRAALATLAVHFSGAWAVLFGLALVLALFSLNRISEFLYWQF